MPVNKELQDYFSSLKVEIILYPESTSRGFKSLSSFNDFISKEYGFWSGCSSGSVNNIRQYFNQILTELLLSIKNVQKRRRNLSRQISITIINFMGGKVRAVSGGN